MIQNLRFWSAAQIVVAGISAIWIIFLATQPVHVPVLEISREFSPLRTQVLSGVKGQTFVAPTDSISRVDIWLHTKVDPGEFVRVKFELLTEPGNGKSLASHIAVFKQSGSWQVRLLFHPNLARENDKLYLRLESILSASTSHLYLDYFRENLYPHGDLLDLDTLGVEGQDLRFIVYRSPTLPRPLAWAETVMHNTVHAASDAKGPSGVVVVVLVCVIGVLGFSIAIATVLIAVRAIRGRIDPSTTLALTLFVAAICLAITAGSEAPFGKLVLGLN